MQRYGAENEKKRSNEKNVRIDEGCAHLRVWLWQTHKKIDVHSHPHRNEALNHTSHSFGFLLLFCYTKKGLFFIYTRQNLSFLPPFLPLTDNTETPLTSSPGIDTAPPTFPAPKTKRRGQLPRRKDTGKPPYDGGRGGLDTRGG